MKTLIALLLAGFSAWPVFGRASFGWTDTGFMGQQYVASAPGAWYPTNLAGCVAWFVAADYTTNSTLNQPVITNRADGLTYFYSDDWQGRWFSKTVGGLGGKDYLSGTTGLGGTGDLLCKGLTNVEPFELWVVFKDYDSNDGPLISSQGGNPHWEFANQNISDWRLYAGDGSHFLNVPRVVNTWNVMTIVSAGPNSTVWTNNAVNASGVPDLSPEGNQDGISWGCNFNESHFAATDFAEMIIYSTTNTAANRVLIYNYLHSYYGVGQ